MSASLIIERPPTPPRSTDGESGSVEIRSQPEPAAPHTPPQTIFPTPKSEDKISQEVQSQPEPAAPYTPSQTILPTPKSEDNITQAPKVEDDAVSGYDAPSAHPASPDHDSYGDPSLYQTAAPVNTFYPIQPVSNVSRPLRENGSLTPGFQTFVRTTQLRTLPAAYNDDRIHTRSGRALGSPLSPTFRSSSRVAKSPRMKTTPKAAKKSKPPKPGAPMLDEPLSVLTKDYNIPVKDMDAWVHRPVSERLEQAAKNKDHVSRPMNSFMLYRSAYADRAKHFCKENNHQIVSQVTGASWPLEPKEVRQMYEDFARIERDAHHNAHPDYKFAPKKQGVTKRAYHDVDDDDDDDDPEWEGSRSRRTKRSQTATSGTGGSQSSTPFDHRFQSPYHPAIHPSSYWASNPHGQPPMGIGPESYYQPVVNQYNQQVDEAAMRRMQYPQYAQGQLIGLPHSNHPVLLAPQYHDQMQMQRDVIDPQLNGGEQQYQYSHYETVHAGYEAPRTYEYSGYPVQHQQYYEEQPQSLHPGMATLTDDLDGWDQPGAEFDQALERWS